MKKGINMLTLSVVIVVILIITSATSISILNIKENSDKTKFVSEITLINQEIVSYKYKTGNYPEKGTISLNLEELSEKAVEQFKGENITVSNNITLFLIDFEKIGIENYSYFSRFFKKKTGMTVTEYSSLHGISLR